MTSSEEGAQGRPYLSSWALKARKKWGGTDLGIQPVASAGELNDL